MAVGRPTKKSLTLFVLVIFDIAVAYFLVYPFWNKAMLSKSELTRSEIDHAKFVLVQGESQSFLDQYRSLSSDAALVSAALPVKDVKTPNLLALLDNFAQAAGLSLANISLVDKPAEQTVVAENTVQAQEVDLAVSGTYPSFKDFVLRLQSSLRLIDIEEVSLQVDDQGNINYQLKLQVYYQK